MAPEQAAGRRGQVGPASDVYSLGTILYQMLTGRPPFQAASPVDTVLLLLEQEPLPPRLLNPRADRELEMIALKCLQKPPELRYATAARAGRRPAGLSGRRADRRPLRPVQPGAGPLVSRNPPRHGAGKLGRVLDVAQPGVAGAFAGDQLAAVQGELSPWPYLGLWVAGLGTWAGIFWFLRRRAGPVTFVERQIAHVWAASVISIAGLFCVEIVMGMQVLTLSPIIALTSSMVFVAKAGILTGKFYAQAAALFATALAMAYLEQQGHSLRHHAIRHRRRTLVLHSRPEILPPAALGGAERRQLIRCRRWIQRRAVGLAPRFAATTDKKEITGMTGDTGDGGRERPRYRHASN